MSCPRELRATFDEVAELYDRARPEYPQELLADLVKLAGIQPGCRLLEIGCGTGQLTVPLAQKGCEIVALDIGAAMVAVARRKLAAYPNVSVITAAFEDWPLPNQHFDVVATATAFHWLDPAIRVHKAADALRPGGALATIATHHIAGGTADFFIEAQECYLKWDPSTQPGFRLPTASGIPADSEELDRSSRFGPAIFRRHEWEKEYSTRAYLDALLTYSGHRTLPERSLQGLLDCIGCLIDSRYGGKIVKRAARCPPRERVKAGCPRTQVSEGEKKIGGSGFSRLTWEAFVACCGHVVRLRSSRDPRVHTRRLPVLGGWNRSCWTPWLPCSRTLQTRQSQWLPRSST